MNVVETKLLPFDERVFHPTPASFTVPTKELLHQTQKSSVARGILTNTDGSQADTACKVVWGIDARERLKREADIYINELNLLQGIDVPKFYGAGIYTGELHEKVISCIFLEYCGEPPKTSILANRPLWYVSLPQQLWLT